MNSIRPLVTITILAVVGAWLYVKINEGPAQHEHGEAEAFHDHADNGVPPLAATPSAPATDAGTAPKWPATAASAPPVAAPATLQPAPATAGTNGLPDMPAIPALPDVSSPLQPAPPAAAASSVPVTLPADIPSARYPDSTSTTANDASVSSGNTTQLAPSHVAVPDATAIGSVPAAAPQAAPPATADHESTIASDNAMAAVGLTPQPQTIQQPTTGADRYGQSGADPSNPLREASAPPVEPTFHGAWPEIQAALDRGELSRAHRLLSKWYGDDSLTPAEAERVNTLLGQLAGTVVYSTEHQLEPAYVVKPGDTLGTIAQQFNVPWQLLAKINGVPSADSVQAGQSLKVIRGPFSAVVDLGRSQLTLMLDGRYAGKFPITVPTGSTVTEGQWLVDRKLATPSTGVAQTSYAPAPSALDRAIVLRGEDGSTGKPVTAGLTLTIASGPAATGTAGNPPAIRLSPQDAEELSDILSVGSRVIVRR